MNVEAMSFQQLVGAVACVLVLLGIYNTAMSAVKNHREEVRRRNAPVENLNEKVEKYDRQFEQDKKRLDKMEDEMAIILRGLMAVISHEINGNSNDKLKQALDEINDYLLKR